MRLPYKFQRDYRKDIDGLRAISVLMVVFYHLDSTIFRSGYVGVDIFFVISGFLITSHILNETNKQQFSFNTFYLKRIRRILPAFITVLLATSIVAYFIFLPGDLRNYAHQALSSAIFVSNIDFWKNLTAGYFHTDSNNIPLLHTWSLGVEEQYYLIWPILIWLIYKISNKRSFYFKLSIAASIIFIISFATCLLSPLLAGLVPEHPHFITKGLYFSPISRAFEPMLGSLLAITHQKIELPKNRKFLHGLSLLALITIAYSGVFLSSNHYPGLSTLLPCISAVLLILTGKEGYPFGNKLLSNQAFTFIGLISFSLYLWHWPIISFLHYLHEPLTFKIQVAILLSSIILAYLTWRWVEIPFRFKIKAGLIKSGLSFVAFPALLMCGLIAILSFSPYLGFNSISPLAYKQGQTYFGVLKKSSLCIKGGGTATLPSTHLCTIGKSGKSKFDAILVGDSHAMADTEMLNILLKNANLKAYVATQAGSPFILGDIANWNAYKPMVRNKLLARHLKEKKYHYVIFGGAWHSYTFLHHKKNDSNTKAYQVLMEGFKKALRLVTSNAGIPVIILDSPPLLNIDKYCGFSKISTKKCYNLLNKINTADGKSRSLILSLKKKFPQIIFIDLKKIICDKEKCYGSISNTPLYKDSGNISHLNASGSKLIGQLYLRTFGNPFLSKNQQITQPNYRGVLTANN
jgi:peptidoglycan/LPS O-acetylase OafA/YrhL